MTFEEKCRDPRSCDISKGDTQCPYVISRDEDHYTCCTFKEGHEGGHQTSYSGDDSKKNWVKKVPDVEDLQEKLMTKEEELQLEKYNHDQLKRAFNDLNHRFEELSLIYLRDVTNAGTKLTIKQTVLHQLVMSSQSAFPHWFSAKGRWDKAEELYKEGVKRGHYPND